jgi:hypothetical protein
MKLTIPISKKHELVLTWERSAWLVRGDAWLAAKIQPAVQRLIAMLSKRKR